MEWESIFATANRSLATFVRVLQQLNYIKKNKARGKPVANKKNNQQQKTYVLIVNASTSTGVGYGLGLPSRAHVPPCPLPAAGTRRHQQ